MRRSILRLSITVLVFFIVILIFNIPSHDERIHEEIKIYIHDRYEGEMFRYFTSNQPKGTYMQYMKRTKLVLEYEALNKFGKEKFEVYKRLENQK